MRLTKEFRFEASHQIHNHLGKCARLHGHSWVLKVTIEGRIDPETGMVLDFYDIKTIVQPVIDTLDHRHLGWSSNLEATVWGLPKPPTSENILIWIAQQLPLDFPWRMLELNETCTSAAILEKEEFLRVAYIDTKGGLRGETKVSQTERDEEREQKREEGRQVAGYIGDNGPF